MRLKVRLKLQRLKLDSNCSASPVAIRPDSSCALCCADIAGDLFTFYSLQSSGHTDLFVAFAIFLVPALLCSAASLGMKATLVIKRVAQRRGALKPSRPTASLSNDAVSTRRLGFRFLAERFVLHRDKERHGDEWSAATADRYEAYSYLLLVVAEVSERRPSLRPLPHSDCWSTWLLAAGPAVLYHRYDPSGQNRER